MKQNIFSISKIYFVEALHIYTALYIYLAEKYSLDRKKKKNINII